MKRTRRHARLVVSADGSNVVSHVGARLLSDLADAVGLTGGLSVAMAATKQRRRGHDRGEVLADLAVMIADGGDTISDLAVLRNQPDLFGEVASTPTAWRTLEAMDTAALDRIATARAAARRRVWAAGADPGFYVIDIDATLVTAHSDKQGAAPTYKRGFGHHPLLAFLDATGEALAGILRPGNAGSNTASDHIEILAMALAQLPIDPNVVEIVARADSAGLTHGFVDAAARAGCGSRSVTTSPTSSERPVSASPHALGGRRSRPTVATIARARRSRRSPTSSTCHVGLSGHGRSLDAKNPTPARNSPSPTLTGTDSRSSSPTRPTPTSPTSKPSNAAAGGPRN